MTEKVVPQIMHCVAMRSGTHTGASGESCSASGAAGLGWPPSPADRGRLVWRSASRNASSHTSFSCGVSAMTVNDFSVVITWNALTSSVFVGNHHNHHRMKSNGAKGENQEEHKTNRRCRGGS